MNHNPERRGDNTHLSTFLRKDYFDINNDCGFSTGQFKTIKKQMEIRGKIKAAGLKATPQRRIVYDIMSELRHGSIDEVIARVQKNSPDVTVSTIYRIMESFCQAGLLSRTNHPNGKTLFDITPTEHHHIFNSTNDIVDFEDDELIELIKQKVMAKIGDSEKIQSISIQVITQIM